MSDLVFSMRLTADGSNYVGNVKVAQAATDQLGASATRASAAQSAFEAQQRRTNSALEDFSDEAQKILDRYNPVEARIRSLSNAVLTLERDIASGKGTDSQALQAVDTVSKLNAEIGRLEQTGIAAGSAIAGGMGTAGKGADGLRLATAGVTREFIVLGHEAMQGNFSRMPGSLVVMLERMGGLHSLLNPLTIGFAAAGGAALAFGLAVQHAAEQTETLERQIEATGNFAGVTAQQVNEIAIAAAHASTLTVGTAKDIATQIVATGQVGADLFGKFIKLTDDYAAVTGESAEKAATSLLKMFDDPARAAEKLNEQYHFLTASELEHIKALEQQGDKQSALTILIDALDKRLPDHAQHVTGLAAAWDRVKQAVSGAINSASGVDSEITRLQAEIAQRLAINSTVFGKSGIHLFDTQVPELQAALDKLLAIKQAAADKAKSDHESAEFNAQQAQSMSLVDKYAKDATERAALLAAKKQVGLFVATTPEEAAKQLEAIQQIDTALANLGKKAQGPSDVRNALLAMDREAANAQIALDNVGRTIDERTTPAMRKLADLKMSDVWSRMTAAQQAHAIAAAETADALQRQTAQAQAAFKVGEQFSGSLTKIVGGFDQEQTKAEAAITSLQRYGVATRDTQEAQLDYFLSLDSTQAALAAMDAVMPGLSDMLIANARAHAQAADATKADEAAMKAWIDAANKAVEAGEKSNDSIERQIAKLQEQADTMGLSKSQLDAYRIANLDTAIAIDERALAEERARDGDDIGYYEQKIALLKQYRDVQQAVFDKQVAQDFQRSFDRAVQGISGDLTNAVIDGFHNGGDAALNDLKRMFDQLVLRPVIQALIQPVVGSVAGSLSGALGLPGAGGAGGGGISPTSFLGGGSSVFGQLPFVSGAGPLAGSGTGIAGFLAGHGFDSLASVAAGAGSPFATISTAVTQGMAAAGGVAGIVGAAIPLIGGALALASFAGLFDHKPSPVQGQFAVTGGTTGFEDNAYTASGAGNLGFLDASTAQFSGQAAQVFNQVVGGAIDAFEQRYSAEQRDRLAQVLQATTFAGSSGTFTTEDFIKQYGGQVLQQVVSAAFDILDPALGSLARQFTGDADAVSKYGNTLLAVYDATKDFDQGLRDNVIAALGDATQATADKVLAFVNAVAQFGGALGSLEGLDPAQITALVDAFGGAQQFTATFSAFGQNFTTQADATAAATQRLDDVFGSLGRTVPTTHADFVKIVDDLIAVGDTDAAEQVLSVSDAFVTMHGTAEAAAQALNQAAQQGRDYYTQHFLSPDEQLAQRQGVDETALFNATAAGTKLNDVLRDMGLDVIPSTVKGVHDLVQAVVAKYGADSDEAKALYAILPIIGDLIDSVHGFGDAATDAADQVAQAASVIVTSVGSIIKQASEQAKTLLGQFADLAGQSTGDFGAKLSIQIGLIDNAIANADRSQFTSGTAFDTYVGKLSASEKSFKVELAEFNRLSLQYDASRAEQLIALEEWRNEQNQIFHGNADDLAVVNEIFQQRWDAIVNGVQTGVDGTVSQLERLQQSIADFLKSLFTGELSPLTPKQMLDQAQAAYNADLAAADPSNHDSDARMQALSEITKDAQDLLRIGSSYYSTPSQQYRDLFDEVTHDLGGLAGTQPNGLPLTTSAKDATTAAVTTLANAVPTDSKLASSRDISQLGAFFQKVIADLAAANGSDIEAQTEEITTTQRRTATVALK